MLNGDPECFNALLSGQPSDDEGLSRLLRFLLAAAGLDTARGGGWAGLPDRAYSAIRDNCPELLSAPQQQQQQQPHSVWQRLSGTTFSAVRDLLSKTLATNALQHVESVNPAPRR